MKDLMNQFVCARLVQANRLDLTKFQFDYDLTFAIFFMNADGTIYGRYGTRSSIKEAEKELSSEGFMASMHAALKVHQGYPKNKGLLEGKQAKPTKFKTPNDFPSLRGKYQATINYKNNTSRSCLHCHQVNDAHRAIYRDAGKRIPDELIFIYPLPKEVGFSLDPKTRATVSKVIDNSPADKAGMQEGDELLTLDGQSILSIADVQWVLHHAGSRDRLPMTVQREGGKTADLTLVLEEGWRRKVNIAWRVSSWPLRRMGTGGLRLAEMSNEELKRAGLNESQLALKVDHVGQYGAHAVAKRAGFRKGDILTSFAGNTKAMTRSEFLAFATQSTKPGQRVEVGVLRNGRRMKLRLLMQR